jgi:mRNA-degrading endonuclease toxin of MazEF toxin-antitoxin module
VLAVRLTTTPKRPRPSIVKLGHPEPFAGRAVCDDSETLRGDEVRRELGALSPAAMALIEVGLRAALGMG